MKKVDITLLEKEFWYHVSAQEELPLAEKKKNLPLQDDLNQLCGKISGDIDIKKLLEIEIYKNPELIKQLRTLVSISDKRFYLDLSYKFSREYVDKGNQETLCGCVPESLTKHSTSFFISLIKKKNEKSHIATRYIVEYLCQKGLEKILDFYAKLSLIDREIIMESLILPKEIQQQDAKLRGHGPEKRLAELVKKLNCSFYPPDKDINPMGKHDPNIAYDNMKICSRDSATTFSTDLIILDKNNSPMVGVVGLVHSSDPGQFGVDKANTVKLIRGNMDHFNNNNKENRNIELWGLVDGVGYSENKKGTINAMLPYFHNFIQIKSLWKAAIGLHGLGYCSVKGIMFNKYFYTNTKILEYMKQYIPADIKIYDFDHEKYQQGYQAGEASLFI